ncbi:hypothetical protein V6N12_057489 [Hibiscus sabdariffa]|uniref:Phorbol-ester/DAG-type domain-containing protein n=1 Tax=Hibiscus sabdariffa TaxID=183260 RepID=A0ABR2C6Q8_9ROSI
MERVENSVSVIKTKGDEFFDSINDIGEADTIAMVIKHFSHPHNLTLNSKVTDDKLCDCCMKPILEQFYSCEECDISVHKTCLELPRKKQHPLHPHPLTLLEKHPNFGGLFFCDGCHQRCHGFTYSCEQCEFNLDVRCGSLSNILKHKSHEHPLVFSQGTKCSACGYSNEGLYSCSDCNFSLDFACASLPNTTRHKNHEHPLDLTYQDEADQIYCNICEEGIGPNRWFYCCKACDFYGHPKCASEQYPYIKLGRTYPYEAHPHPVAFVHKAKGQPPCSKSGNPCKGLALKWVCWDSRRAATYDVHDQPDPDVPIGVKHLEVGTSYWRGEALGTPSSEPFLFPSPYPDIALRFRFFGRIN